MNDYLIKALLLDVLGGQFTSQTRRHLRPVTTVCAPPTDSFGSHVNRTEGHIVSSGDIVNEVYKPLRIWECSECQKQWTYAANDAPWCCPYCLTTGSVMFVDDLEERATDWVPGDV